MGRNAIKPVTIKIDDDVTVEIDFKSGVIGLISGTSEIWLTQRQFVDVISAVGSHQWANVSKE